MESDDGLRHKDSGYRGGVAAWRRFLSCWYRNPGPNGRMLILRDPLADEAALVAAEETYRHKIEYAEKRLEVNLPQSYVDFLLAYQPSESYGEDGKRLVSADALATLGVVQPGYVRGMVRIASECGGLMSDDEYYVYGARQDSPPGRPGYLEKALCVGYHGYDLFEMIVLHPQVTTRDGEMEASMHSYADSARAPNFAEIMRYVYEFEVFGTYSRGSGIPGPCDSARLPMVRWWL